MMRLLHIRIDREGIPMAETAETVLLERDGRVAILTFNRTEKLNALNDQVREELLAHLAARENDAGIGAVVLPGAGEPAFTAGADIAEFAGRSPLAQRHAMRSTRMSAVLCCFPT